MVPDGIDDDKVLFLSDILPTGWMAAVNCDIEPGDVVAVWGCGPVGLFAIQSALLLGAHRVIAIDHYPRRLALAKQLGAEILDFEAGERARGAGGDDRRHRPRRLHRRGRHGESRHVAGQHRSITSRRRPSWRRTASHALRQVILATRKGGRVSIPGVYGGIADKFPIGALMEKGLQLKSGQTHVQKYMRRAARHDPRRQARHDFLISHRLDLEDAALGYKNFKEKQNEYTKVVLKPGMGR